MMPQPPYSPDLAPCDFFLFPKLKRPMKGRRCATLDEIKTASKEELKRFFKNDFLKCFEDWKNRWHKCIISHGDYFEGDKIAPLAHLIAASSFLMGLCGSHLQPRRKTSISVPQIWLKKVPDSTPLSRLALPGSHASLARWGLPVLKRQDLSVLEQLRTGIRVLDLTLRSFRGALPAYYNGIFQRIVLDDVLVDVSFFLRLRPSETVVLRIRMDPGCDSDSDVSSSVRACLLRCLGVKQQLWTDTQRLPLLGEARGKAIVLQDFPAGEKVSIIETNILLKILERCGIEYKVEETLSTKKRTHESPSDSTSRSHKTPRMEVVSQHNENDVSMNEVTEVPQETSAATPPQVNEEDIDEDGPWTKVTHAKKPRIPPVIAENVTDWKLLCQELKDLCTDKFQCTISGNKHIIKAKNISDFKKIREYVQKNNGGYSYRLQEEKPLKVVLKGVTTAYKTEDIAIELATMGFTETSVKRLHRQSTKRPMNLVLVELPKNEQNKKIYGITELLYQKIAVESFRTTNRVTQCFNCQGFGHGQLNCFLKPKCVKCAEEHHSKDCPRKSRQLPPKCANCEEAHTANYRGCPKFPRVHQQQPRYPGQYKPNNPLPISKRSETLPKIVEQQNQSNAEVVTRKTSRSETKDLCEKLMQKEELLHFLEDNSIDIALLSETHLKPSIDLKFRNYQTIRTDRITGKGGGTAIILKSFFKYKNMLIHTLNLENTSILIKPDGKTLLQITAIYKKPDAPLLEEDLNQLIKHNHSIIVAGDWNFKHPLWGSRTSNNSGIVLHNFSERESLDIVAPSSPTHYSPLGNPDFLDFAVLKNIPWTPKARTTDDLSSDHLPVIFELNCPKDEFTTQLSRVTNWVHFQQDLISTTPPRLPLKTEVDIDSAVGILNEKINNSYSKNTIVSSSKLIKNPKTKALIREKNKARKRWQSTWDPAHRATYLNLQGKVNQALEAEKSENWNSFLSKLESSPTDFWKKTKPIRKKTEKITSLNANGKTLLTDKEIGNDLSEHFSKHFSKAEDEVPSYLTDNTCHHPQENILSMTTPNEVKEVIKNLGNHKAPGHDNITPQMTKNLPIKWIVFLAGIFNAALHLCYFPKTWKHAIIITIPKKSPVKSPEDLRPISLLSTIGKVYERIVLRRLQSYMDSINFIIPQQFGFRKGHSTTHQLITVIDYIQIRKSHKEAVGAVFLDFTKAFDRVWHDGLIAKITKNQFPRDFIKFLKNYLQDRTFSIKQGNYITTAKPTQIGVPQGSILGPYLFNIYINDFPPHPKCQIKLFADDVAILSNSKSIGIITTQLQNYINSITKWCNDWKLDINPKKSQAIIFPPLENKKFKPQSIQKVNQSPINWTDSVKYLGVTLDSKLKFNMHVKNIIKKAKIAKITLSSLFNYRSKLTTKQRFTLYRSCILPIVTYALPVWCKYITTTDKNRINAFMRICLRTSIGAPFNLSNKILKEDLNQPDLEDIYQTSVKKLYLQMQNSNNPTIQDILQNKGDINPRFRRPGPDT
ncbi:hypothetical protein LAZ67_9000338 [Cordylochernes scorpioides]|uniref:Reverse transcriptase domain-containing protein n=1 Tax=Cordylochernes scorpioides TaxID=51811 RepID=A0ABY6KXG2_9ARAC|nr:hypothetical protein LAZ67_9000338 [Cordylochernes scorpioides]